MTSARDTDFKNFSFAQTRQFYSDLRTALFEEANERWVNLNITPISYADAKEADTWANLGPPERSAWSWIDAYGAYNRRDSFKRFEICVKRGGRVLGLSYGIPTKSKTKLKVDIIEATPYREHKQDTKVFEVISETAQMYAVLLGADEVRIMNPLNEKLTAYYCSYGYQYVESAKKSLGVYCSLKIKV